MTKDINLNCRICNYNKLVKYHYLKNISKIASKLRYFSYFINIFIPFVKLINSFVSGKKNV
jgi:membrane protein DedA with SNARE-associated domain